jgi:hypothetical protein
LISKNKALASTKLKMAQPFDALAVPLRRFQRNPLRSTHLNKILWNTG